MRQGSRDTDTVAVALCGRSYESLARVLASRGMRGTRDMPRVLRTPLNDSRPHASAPPVLLRGLLLELY